MTKDWIQYGTWTRIKKDKEAFDQYIKYRNKVHNSFKFDWTNVWKQVKPKLYIKKESIGLIKCELDGKTLYVDCMHTSRTDYISHTLTKKYSNKIGYYIFHTHPIDKKVSPLPSDQDILVSLLYSLDLTFLGEVLISEYGIFIYYLPMSIRNHILQNNNYLAYFTYCYNVISAWNSFLSMNKYRIQDRISILKRFGMHIHHISTKKYIEDNRKNQCSYILRVEKTDLAIDNILNTINYLKNNKGQNG